MADSEVITIPLCLPRNEAVALAQFVKRIDFDTCARFAALTVTYDGPAERNVIWSGVLTLQGALASAGYTTR